MEGKEVRGTATLSEITSYCVHVIELQCTIMNVYSAVLLHTRLAA